MSVSKLQSRTLVSHLLPPFLFGCQSALFLGATHIVAKQTKAGSQWFHTSQSVPFTCSSPAQLPQLVNNLSILEQMSRFLLGSQNISAISKDLNSTLNKGFYSTFLYYVTNMYTFNNKLKLNEQNKSEDSSQAHVTPCSFSVFISKGLSDPSS